MFALKKLPTPTLSYVMRTSTRFSSLQREIKPTPPIPPPQGENDTVDLAKMRIYQNRSTLDLLNMLVMNTVCTKDIFVDNCHHLYKLSTKIAGSRITEALIGNTMGKIFTAGDSLETVEDFIKNWPNKNISLYIDYSNEAVPGQVITKECLDDNARVFCDTIPLATKAGANSGIAIKPSALCLHATLVRANTAEENIRSLFSNGFGNLNETLTARQVMEELADMKIDATFSDLKEFFALFLNKELKSEADLDVISVTKFEWLNNVHAYDVLSAEKNNNKIISQFTKFSLEDYSEMQALVGRMDSIFKRAYEEKSNVLVDAEQTYLQSAIDDLTNQFSVVYNKEMPVVMNTFQNYLKTTKDRVLYELERCKAFKLPFAAKLVRGAYMVEERRLAKEKGYPDPIHNTVQETHDCYNGNVKDVMQNWIQGSHLMVASHNEESIKLGAKLVKEFNITPEKGNVTFIQLLGLADHLTYTTAGQGLTTAKYVPFGPISIMIPYLIRRAQESKQMLASASLQRSFVLGELGNRLKRKL